MMRLCRQLSLPERFGVSNSSTEPWPPWIRRAVCLGFIRSQICRPPLESTRPSACRPRERQSMTDRTLSISAALREAQLQRLEASLATKTAAKPSSTAEQSKNTSKTERH